MSTASQQASAVEAAARIISGASIKPSASEKTFLAEKLKDAATTLRQIASDRGER